MVAADPKDTATLVMSGAFRLSDFARAMHGFDGLITSLRRDYAQGADVPWILDDLEASGSGEATARALASTRGAWHSAGELTGVEQVIAEYEAVGRALQLHQSLARFSADVQRSAEELRGVLDGNVRGLRFETATADVDVAAASNRGAGAPVLLGGPGAGVFGVGGHSLGAVQGRVESVSRRGGLRFTLYESIKALPVSCYLSKDQEGCMSELWGRLVIVEGMVRRDPMTGEPTTIRQIREIRPVAEDKTIWEYDRARGVTARWRKGGPSSEEIIRRSRDG